MTAASTSTPTPLVVPAEITIVHDVGDGVMGIVLTLLGALILFGGRRR